MQDSIRRQIESGIETKRKVLDTLVPSIEKTAQLFIDAIKSGNKILFFGNGGSASDSQHLAAEFVGRYEKDRRPLAAIALTTDTSILTSVANDYSYADVFTRQVEALGKKGDVAVGISTSGNSESVIKALEKARSLGLKTVSFIGKDGGKMKGKSDIDLIVSVDKVSRIQESHIMIGHILCELVDKALFP